MRCYNITDRNEREIVVIGSPGLRVDAGWAGGSVRRTDYIGADNIKLLRIKNTAFPYQSLPPVFRIGIRRECVTDPDNVVAGFIELPPGMIGYGNFRELSPGLQMKCLLIMIQMWLHNPPGNSFVFANIPNKSKQ